MTESKPVFSNALCYNGKELRQMLGSIVGTEGVADVMAGSLLVTTSGSGLGVLIAAGGAFVTGDTDVNQGKYANYNDSVATSRTVGTADPTNPRIDQIIYRVYDSEIGDSSDVGVIEVLPGVAVGGATLANLNGAAALPNNAIRLAYILVPAAFTGPFVNATHIKDARTPWASAGEPKVASTMWSRATNQSLNNDAETVITYPAGASNTAVPNAFYSESGGTITILRTGLYLVSGEITYAANADSNRRQVTIYKNATQLFRQTSPALNSATLPTVLARAGAVLLTAGDTLDMQGKQTSGGALNVTAAFLSLTRIGALAA